LGFSGARRSLFFGIGLPEQSQVSVHVGEHFFGAMGLP
jgi:hypothetical protein